MQYICDIIHWKLRREQRPTEKKVFIQKRRKVCDINVTGAKAPHATPSNDASTAVTVRMLTWEMCTRWALLNQEVLYRQLYTVLILKTAVYLSIVLTAMDQKPQKSLKRWYYPPSHCLNVNVMLSNMTFLMIFAVFDPLPLTLWTMQTQRKMEKVRPWCGQPSDRGRLKNRTEYIAVQRSDSKITVLKIDLTIDSYLTAFLE